MSRSSGFGFTCTYLFALFRLAFATAPDLLLNLASAHNSPAHSSIGTSSGLNALWLFVSIQFQILFTPLPRFFSPFLHSTGSLSVTEEYLVLRDGPRTFRQDSTCLAVLWTRLDCDFYEYRTFTFYGMSFKHFFLFATHWCLIRTPLNGLDCSAFARHYLRNTISLSFPLGT